MKFQNYTKKNLKRLFKKAKEIKPKKNLDVEKMEKLIEKNLNFLLEH